MGSSCWGFESCWWERNFHLHRYVFNIQDCIYTLIFCILSDTLWILRTHCLYVTGAYSSKCNSFKTWIGVNKPEHYSPIFSAIFFFRLICSLGLFLELSLSQFAFHVVYFISPPWDIFLMEIWEVDKKNCRGYWF